METCFNNTFSSANHLLHFTFVSVLFPKNLLHFYWVDPFAEKCLTSWFPLPLLEHETSCGLLLTQPTVQRCCNLPGQRENSPAGRIPPPVKNKSEDWEKHPGGYCFQLVRKHFNANQPHAILKLLQINQSVFFLYPSKVTFPQNLRCYTKMSPSESISTSWSCRFKRPMSVSGSTTEGSKTRDISMLPPPQKR